MSADTHNLVRSVERYAQCSAEAVSGGSAAQMLFFVQDAKADIASLASALEASEAKIAVLAADNDALREKVKRLHHAGSLLSNCCYNLSQRAGKVISEDDAEAMRRSYKSFDAALREEGKP